MKNFYRTCALTLGVATLFAASGLNASTFYTEKVAIPFDFKVSRTTLPAGEYRVQRNSGEGFSYLTNVKTGQMVQVLRSNGGQVDGRAKLVFETKNGNRTLKTIW
jgi:hypothetical protein